MTTRVRLWRVYEPATPEDGRRILVDQLWPRGVSKLTLVYGARDEQQGGPRRAFVVLMTA
jgi:uncharacterized protein YeaO (DUF488 family)